jgi:hypothetical protein
MLRILTTGAAALVLLLPVSPGNAATGASGGCRFVLGFAALEQLSPAQVGTCLANEAYNPVNGDTLQQTTGGLLVWRKSDSWTAFTDGYRTWVNGPYGLQERLNTQRFAWEANPESLPPAGSPPNHDCGATAGAGKVQTLCPPP